MINYIEILISSGLFKNIPEEETQKMLQRLEIKIKDCKKGEYVLRLNEKISSIGLLTKGELLIQKEDYWGNLSILNRLEKGEIFAEAYAPENAPAFENNVIAAKDSQALFIGFKSLMSLCSADRTKTPFAHVLMQNLFSLAAEKNRRLAKKSEHLSQRTLREKLLSYLSEECQKSGSPTFKIPFNRQELADFLCADRSALSRELSKMQKENLLRYRKNTFTLIKLQHHQPS